MYSFFIEIELAPNSPAQEKIAESSKYKMFHFIFHSFIWNNYINFLRISFNVTQYYVDFIGNEEDTEKDDDYQILEEYDDSSTTSDSDSAEIGTQQNKNLSKKKSKALKVIEFNN